MSAVSEFCLCNGMFAGLQWLAGGGGYAGSPWYVCWVVFKAGSSNIPVMQPSTHSQ